MEFDYVVVGGGSAGCMLASRLSENPSITVALIEAGTPNNAKAVTIPFLTVLTLPYWYKNWHYSTTPQQGLNGRCGYQPRGKVLGGSSAINAMIYIRGQAQDYDDWAKDLGSEWSFQSVLPLFKSFEHNENINDEYHGQNGLLNVCNLSAPREVSNAFVSAANACGHPINSDFNGSNQHGVGLYQVTQKKGKRYSAADAFIKPIAHRQNLTVICNSYAHSLKISGKTCTGVYISTKKKLQEVRAKKEVVLAAGAFGSPQVLLLSGVGPEEELKRHGIKVNHILPGVGKNLHDHIDYVMAYQSRHPSTIGFNVGGLWDIYKEYRAYKTSNSGMMTTNFAEAGGFLKTESQMERPDIQLHFVVGIVDNHARNLHFKRGFSCHVCVLRPKSRGDVRLKSASIYDAPLINPNFLAHEHDVTTLLNGFKKTREILEHPDLASFREKELFTDKLDDQSVIELLRNRADTVYHPVGSCKMGRCQMSVVDPQLRVHGIDNLRIADASVMPEVVSGNTNAPTMMIALRAANLMLKEV
jgi:choline dehydrogenase-like flavoprotein